MRHTPSRYDVSYREGRVHEIGNACIAVVWAHSTGNINEATGEVGYYVPKGAGLSFSVAIFCLLALVCVGGLFVRRLTVGAELGGSKWGTRIWGAFFMYVPVH